MGVKIKGKTIYQVVLTKVLLSSIYKYGKEGGLRYQMMTYQQFFDLSDDIIKLTIRITDVPSINSLLNSICNKMDWRRCDYNAIFHNCQDFVCEFIKKLNAVREKFSYFRGFHNSSLGTYPFYLVKQLEKNEEDSINIIDKIPVIGPLEEHFRMIGYMLYFLFKKK